MARAFELALTPAIVGGFGYLLDRWLGIVPVFTIVFFLLGVTGVVVRMYYGYDARMKEHEASGPWADKGTGPWADKGTGPWADKGTTS